MQLTGNTRNISKRCKLLPAVLQIDHTQHVLDAAKSICLPDDQLDLAVGCFDPCVAPAKPYGVQSMAKDCCINIRDKRKTKTPSRQTGHEFIVRWQNTRHKENANSLTEKWKARICR